MSHDNPLWGAPRVHGELLKLGMDVSQATVAKYMTRSQRPPSQTWRTFLANHMGQIAAADFFVVPTATCRLLLVLVILAHERRRIVHVAVTDHPTAAWTAQQLREAFPWNDVRPYLVRDRDSVFHAWAATATAMDIREVITAARSPWQNAYAERLIGSIRRECLDHVIVWNKRGLRRVLQAYVAYYQRSRTHLSLDKDSPVPRAVAPPSAGASLPSRRSADFTIGTNAERRNPRAQLNERCIRATATHSASVASHRAPRTTPSALIGINCRKWPTPEWRQSRNKTADQVFSSDRFVSWLRPPSRGGGTRRWATLTRQ